MDQLLESTKDLPVKLNNSKESHIQAMAKDVFDLPLLLTILTPTIGKVVRHPSGTPQDKDALFPNLIEDTILEIRFLVW